MKPICVKCHLFYKVVENGFYFIETMPEPGAKPGLVEPDKWKPYKLWAGDVWKCQGCGSQIISGTGFDPITEHFQEGFQQLVDALGAEQFRVNDC